VTNDIVFQTHILALNAVVEAEGSGVRLPNEPMAKSRRNTAKQKAKSSSDPDNWTTF
jgi:uncharacterized protein YycO